MKKFSILESTSQQYQFDVQIEFQGFEPIVLKSKPVSIDRHGQEVENGSSILAVGGEDEMARIIEDKLKSFNNPAAGWFTMLSHSVVKIDRI